MRLRRKSVDKLSDAELWERLVSVQKEIERWLDDWAYSAELKMMHAECRRVAAELHLRGVQLKLDQL